MKRVLLTVLVVGLLATQASASMYTLDRNTADTFRQLGSDGVHNELYLVINNPGLAAGDIVWQVAGDDSTNYGADMQLAVGFVGNLSSTKVMTLGVAGDLPGNDGTSVNSFGAHFANDDNNDAWAVSLYVKEGLTSFASPFKTLSPGTVQFVSLEFTPGTVTEFGFQVDYAASTGSDDFHISVVPVPAALILGLLGMGAAGLKLRRFA